MPRASATERIDPQDNLTLDPDTLDPNKHYRICAERNLSRRRAQGYEVVTKDDGVRFLHHDERVTPAGADGVLRVGGMIVMACDKKRFVERRKQVENLGRARLGSAEEQFVEKARARGRAQGRNVQTIIGEGEE